MQNTFRYDHIDLGPPRALDLQSHIRGSLSSIFKFEKALGDSETHLVYQSITLNNNILLADIGSQVPSLVTCFEHGDRPSRD